FCHGGALRSALFALLFAGSVHLLTLVSAGLARRGGSIPWRAVAIDTGPGAVVPLEHASAGRGGRAGRARRTGQGGPPQDRMAKPPVARRRAAPAWHMCCHD